MCDVNSNASTQGRNAYRLQAGFVPCPTDPSHFRNDTSNSKCTRSLQRHAPRTEKTCQGSSGAHPAQGRARPRTALNMNRAQPAQSLDATEPDASSVHLARTTLVACRVTQNQHTTRHGTRLPFLQGGFHTWHLALIPPQSVQQGVNILQLCMASTSGSGTETGPGSPDTPKGLLQQWILIHIVYFSQKLRA